MLMLAWALASLGLICWGVIVFIGWAIREHHVANKYRHLVALTQAMPAPTAAPSDGQHWIIHFKEGVKTKSITVTGKNESAALSAFAKTGMARYDHIVSISKV